MPEFLRLSTIAPHLIPPLRVAQPGVQRSIAAAVCRFTLETVHLADPQITPLLADVLTGSAPDPHSQSYLAETLEALDTRYFDLLDSVNDLGAPEAPMLELFAKARAVNAVQAGLASDPFLAAAEAIYEANAATDDLLALERIVSEHLSAPGAA